MKKYLYFVFLTIAILGLIKFLSVIPFNRLAGDEFGYAATVFDKGFFGAQALWYTSWSGRYSSTLLQTIVPLIFRNSGNIFLYSLVSVGALIGAFLLFYKSFLKSNNNLNLFVLISVVSSVMLYMLIPNKNESVYWLSGSATYLWPIIISLVVASLMLSEYSINYKKSILSILTFLLCGFNESYSFLIILVSILLIKVKYFSMLGNVKTFSDLFKLNLIRKIPQNYYIFLVFSIIGSLVMFLAPGNANRASSPISDEMNILGAVAYSFQTGPALLLNIIKPFITVVGTFFIVLSTTFSYLIKSSKQYNNDIYSDIVKMFTVLSIPVVASIVYLFPSYMVLGQIPPDRSNVTLSFILLLGILFASYYFARFIVSENLSKSIAFNLMVLTSSFVLLLSSFSFVNNLGRDIYITRGYSIAFDNMYSVLKNAQKENVANIVELPKLPESGLIHSAQVTGNETHWYNQQVASFFNLTAVISK
jgi:hypothetical protein